MIAEVKMNEISQAMGECQVISGFVLSIYLLQWEKLF
jgi:hypothetical protein